MEDILHVSTFKKVTLFLVETTQKEIMFRDKPELIRWKGRAGDFTTTLLDEMKRYARQRYPFNQQFDENCVKERTSEQRTCPNSPSELHIQLETRMNQC
jgi:hypothetical protein